MSIEPLEISRLTMCSGCSLEVDLYATRVNAIRADVIAPRGGRQLMMGVDSITLRCLQETR